MEWRGTAPAIQVIFTLYLEHFFFMPRDFMVSPGTVGLEEVLAKAALDSGRAPVCHHVDVHATLVGKAFTANWTDKWALRIWGVVHCK